MAVEWLKIRNDYINGGGSYRKLAEKYGVSKSTLYKKAKAENWVKLKEENRCKIGAKAEQKIIEKEAKREADRVSRLLGLSDQLADKIEQAISELDIYLAKNKRKTKTVEYNCPSASGKPTKEIIEENEEILELKTMVDRLGLQQVATALKAVKDVQTGLTSFNENNEDDGFIAALTGTAKDDWNGDE